MGKRWLISQQSIDYEGVLSTEVWHSENTPQIKEGFLQFINITGTRHIISGGVITVEEVEEDANK